MSTVIRHGFFMVSSFWLLGQAPGSPRRVDEVGRLMVALQLTGYLAPAGERPACLCRRETHAPR